MAALHTINTYDILTYIRRTLMLILAVILAVFFATFTQSVVGFGTAMVGMPLLVELLGLPVAAPLVALLGLVLELIMLAYYRQTITLRAMLPMILAAAAGIPVGILAVRHLDERVILTVLGAVILGYALYGLLRLRLPTLRHPLWGIGAASLAGVLGGAYNTAGPPMIVYGHCKRWPPEMFRGTLQGFFLFIDVLVTANHAVVGNFTPAVLRMGAVSMLPLLIGFGVGTHFARRIDSQAYSRLVLVMLLVLGVRLIL